jgi:fatty acid desaturase
VSTATVSAAPADFRSLTAEIRAAGLFDRRSSHYNARILLTVGGFGGLWWAFFAIGASWSTLGIAVLLALFSTQLGFLGHDAGHRQVFASGRANRVLGLLVGNALVGLSFGWWVPKHAAHHAHPNEVGRDPDIGVPGATFGGREQVAGERDLRSWLGRHEGELFFPLMLLRSTGLYVSGIQSLLRRRDRAAALEAFLMAVYAISYVTAVFWVLSPAEGLAFIAVHQAVFSFYLGCSFAPNHKGMPLIESDCELTFAERQVSTSRNIIGGACTGLLFGGLNYQIEHHLFPAMPRPNLPRARHLVRSFCAESGLEYREATVVGSFRQAMKPCTSQLSGAIEPRH